MNNEKIVYNADKTEILDFTTLDLSLGYLTDVEEIIHHDAIEEQQEIGHYEVIAEYPNGGKEVMWVIDQPYIPARAEYDEVIYYQTYTPHSEEHLAYRKSVEIYKDALDKLTASDFKVLKYLEGHYTEEAFEQIKKEREHYREIIREHEKDLRPGDWIEIRKVQGLFN